MDEYFSDASLQALKNAIDDIDLPVCDTISECNELLQDLAVNYMAEGLYSDFLTPLIDKAELVSDMPHDDLLNPAYDLIFRNYLANEVFSDLFMPDDSLEDMLLHMEWIAMEYVTIRHSLFLSRLDIPNAAYDNKIIPDYETFCQHIVILSRMTGYENDDIYEYPENSFESPIWDWGYFALIVGKTNDK